MDIFTTMTMMYAGAAFLALSGAISMMYAMWFRNETHKVLHSAAQNRYPRETTELGGSVSVRNFQHPRAIQ
jgi:hypothetical protein